jgi:hypothetical protein
MRTVNVDQDKGAPVLAKSYLPSRILWVELETGARIADIPLRAAEWGERGAEDFYRCLDWLWRAPAPGRRGRSQQETKT